MSNPNIKFSISAENLLLDSQKLSEAKETKSSTVIGGEKMQESIREKAKIKNWITNMTPEERIRLFTMTNEELCDIFIGMFWATHFKEESLFSLKYTKKTKMVYSKERSFLDSFYGLFEGKKVPKNNIGKNETQLKISIAEKEILSAVRFSSNSESFDTFSLDPEFVQKPGRVLEVLETVTESQFAAASDLYREQLNKYRKSLSDNSFPFWFLWKNPNSLGRWITACIERKIFITYEAMMFEQNQMRRRECGNNKVKILPFKMPKREESPDDEASEKPSESDFWSQMSPSAQHQVIVDGVKEAERLRNRVSENLVEESPGQKKLGELLRQICQLQGRNLSQAQLFAKDIKQLQDDCKLFSSLTSISFSNLEDARGILLRFVSLQVRKKFEEDGQKQSISDSKKSKKKKNKKKRGIPKVANAQTSGVVSHNEVLLEFPGSKSPIESQTEATKAGGSPTNPLLVKETSKEEPMQTKSCGVIEQQKQGKTVTIKNMSSAPKTSGPIRASVKSKEEVKKSTRIQGAKSNGSSLSDGEESSLCLDTPKKRPGSRSSSAHHKMHRANESTVQHQKHMITRNSIKEKPLDERNKQDNRPPHTSKNTQANSIQNQATSKKKKALSHTSDGAKEPRENKNKKKIGATNCEAVSSSCKSPDSHFSFSKKAVSEHENTLSLKFDETLSQHFNEYDLIPPNSQQQHHWTPALSTHSEENDQNLFLSGSHLPEVALTSIHSSWTLADSDFIEVSKKTRRRQTKQLRLQNNCGGFSYQFSDQKSCENRNIRSHNLSNNYELQVSPINTRKSTMTHASINAQLKAELSGSYKMPYKKQMTMEPQKRDPGLPLCVARPLSGSTNNQKAVKVYKRWKDDTPVANPREEAHQPCIITIGPKYEPENRKSNSPSRKRGDSLQHQVIQATSGYKSPPKTPPPMNPINLGLENKKNTCYKPKPWTDMGATQPTRSENTNYDTSGRNLVYRGSLMAQPNFRQMINRGPGGLMMMEDGVSHFSISTNDSSMNPFLREGKFQHKSTPSTPKNSRERIKMKEPNSPGSKATIKQKGNQNNARNEQNPMPKGWGYQHPEAAGIKGVSINSRKAHQLSISLMLEKLDRDLEKSYSQAKNESNQINSVRSRILDALRLIVKLTFEETKVDAVLFGSCRTGLALPCSDLDILLKGTNSQNNNDCVEVLHALKGQLEQFPWVIRIKPVFTASVPLLKIRCNPDLPLLDNGKASEKRSDFLNKVISKLPGHLSGGLNPEKLSIGVVKIDITVQDCRTEDNSAGHIGQISTAFTSNLLETHQPLAFLTIVIKKILYIHKLHKSFKGGLNSYGLVLMLGTYLRFVGTFIHVKTNSELLLCIFSYFGATFNPQITVIDYYFGFYSILPMTNEEGKLTVNDPNTLGKNVTQSTFLINNILTLFATLAQKIQDFSLSLQAILEEETDLRSIGSWRDLEAWQTAQVTGSHQATSSKLKKLLSVNLAEDILFNKRYYEVSYMT